MLDNENVMDQSPMLSELSADDYYFVSDYWNKRSVLERNAYIWAKDIYEGNGEVYDWNAPYAQVLNCNVVLKGLEQLSADAGITLWKNTRGTALFKRCFAFFNLAQIFAPVYDSITANVALGIPLRFEPDVTSTTVRSTVEQTYQQIITDLKSASKLLSQTIPDKYTNRPSRAAAFALLSRVYLSMRRYEDAGKYADSSLQLFGSLIDYNSVNAGAFLPFAVDSPENIYNAYFAAPTMSSILPVLGEAIIDSSLYASYEVSDLRKAIFFSTGSGKIRRKNFYDGGVARLYTGLAVDEMVLNRAECNARLHYTEKAMDDMNWLMRNRYVNNLWPPPALSTVEEVLKFILTERRKELVMRGLRWIDLRRLNMEGAKIEPIRIINGNIHKLPPNSNLYTLPIPPDVISKTGIPQNIRD
ncbi:hypothetical protein FLA_1289 [Filimonas lacunae]|nr:hypothetical protein FLA_1289 [Filimonas lacunae]